MSHGNPTIDAQMSASAEPQFILTEHVCCARVRAQGQEWQWDRCDSSTLIFTYYDLFRKACFAPVSSAAAGVQHVLSRHIFSPDATGRGGWRLIVDSCENHTHLEFQRRYVVSALLPSPLSSAAA